MMLGALEVSCPGAICLAQAGSPCHTAGGVARIPHVKRVERSRQATREPQATQPPLPSLHTDCARVERENMGLHAALTEAVRRIMNHNVGRVEREDPHIPWVDLAAALRHPAEAPLDYRDVVVTPSVRTGQ